MYLLCSASSSGKLKGDLVHCFDVGKEDLGYKKVVRNGPFKKRENEEIEMAYKSFI